MQRVEGMGGENWRFWLMDLHDNQLGKNGLNMPLQMVISTVTLKIRLKIQITVSSASCLPGFLQ